MKNISLIFWCSVLLIALGGRVQALDLSAVSASGITPPGRQTLIVVFGQPEGVFEQLLTTPVRAPRAAEDSSKGTPATTPGPPAALQPQDAPAVPEPTTLVLVGVGLLGLFGLARRKLATR